MNEFSLPTYAKIKGLGGAAGGFATLDQAGEVPAEQLPPEPAGTITLSATWTGPDADGDYSQVVTVTGAAVTAQSVVGLRPTKAQVKTLIAAGVTALLIENNAGTLTVYAVGGVPAEALTIQCDVWEVSA
ncbi:MAG: hypothetical protein J6S60_07265 [Oscillospiraceae bacterium]|nr:hypothetical protein [Oscillospiraceae bacterium]